jgi:hypothetical protein
VPLHILLTAAIAVELIAGQILQVLDLRNVGVGEGVAITMTIVCHTMLLLGAATLALGVLTRMLGSSAALLWGVGLLLGNVFFADLFTLRALGLHLDEGCRLVFNLLRAHYAVRPAWLKLARIAVTLSVATAAGAMLTFTKTGGHPRLGLKPVPGWLPAALMLAGAVGLFGARTAWGWSTDPRELELHESAIWQIPINGHIASVLTFPDPTFTHFPDERTAQREIDRIRASPPPRRPNVFLFIVESLRSDVVTPDNAPNLTRMAASGLPIATTLSSANCTHISWYSIFNSTYPIFWRALEARHVQPGSIPLQLMKAMGYRITVIASHSLGYFGADQALFGEHHQLADEFNDLHTFGGRADAKDQPADPALMDQKVMHLLAEDAAAPGRESGQLFIVFLYSSHHRYTWPSDFAPRYTPYEESLEALDAHVPTSPVEIDRVRNRYRNAVAFVDSLIGDFDAQLGSRGQRDSSIEIVTGDHGEEFQERGHFAHASELNRFQTEVPLIFDIPASMHARPIAPSPIASHIDIFPTLFDVLGEWPQLDHTVQGRSLLGDGPGFAVAGRCSSYTPSQILISNGREKALVAVNGPSNLQEQLYADDIQVIDLRGRSDQSLLAGNGAREWSSAAVAHTFGAAFTRMWSTPPER